MEKKKPWLVDIGRNGQEESCAYHYFENEDYARAFARLAFGWGRTVAIMRPPDPDCRIGIYKVEEVLIHNTSRGSAD